MNRNINDNIVDNNFSKIDGGTRNKNKNLKEVKLIQKSLINIITGGDEISSIFPQNESDLIKINDSEKHAFISLINWVLNTIEPDIAQLLRDSILLLDHNFISVVEKAWGRGIYQPCADDLNRPRDTYEIPDDIFDGMNIDSILSITPDIISEDTYEELKKLISIINIVEKYAKKEARGYLSELKVKIKESINRNFTSEKIREQLADHPQKSIELSIKHYDKWIKLSQRETIMKPVISTAI